MFPNDNSNDSNGNNATNINNNAYNYNFNFDYQSSFNNTMISLPTHNLEIDETRMTCHEEESMITTTHKTTPASSTARTQTTSSSASSMISISSMTPLSSTFRPGPLDVICGRGKQAKNHVGNRRFRDMIVQCADKYASVGDSKLDKSLVVSEIVESIRKASPHGGFVKEYSSSSSSSSSQQWYEVGDRMAREKVGQSFRDLLDNQYKSSTKAKWRRRRIEITKEVEVLVQSNCQIRHRIQQLTDTISTLQIDTNDSLSMAERDNLLLRLFTQANCDILQAIKIDPTLQLHSR